MRVPRVRFTVRTLMLGLALSALVISIVARARPYVGHPITESWLTNTPTTSGLLSS